MIEIRVSENGMEAEVAVFPEEGDIIDVKTVRETLQMEGVQAGIDDSVIELLVEKKVYGQFMPVAKGKGAVNGLNGYYDFHFITEEENKAPKILEDGSVDYTKTITNVQEGDLLAEYHPRMPGSYGYNVFATMLPPVNGKELPPLRCRGVRQDGNKYYAEKNGYVTMSNNLLEIQNVLDINGDVDQTVGDLVFNGDIRVHGNIQSGMSVTAQGSIIVDGVIEDAKVYAKNDILVGKGIHGQNVAKVETEGSLSANFINHAFVSVGGDVKIDYAVNSVIEAEGTVVAKGNYGSIVGGKISGVAGVEADTFGNDAQIPTQIHAGTSRKKKEQLKSYKQQLKELEEKTVGFETDKIPELIARMLIDLKSKIFELKKDMMTDKVAPIIVHSKMYPGVKCYLGELMAPDMSGRSGIEFRNIKSKIICKKVGAFSSVELTVLVPAMDSEVLAEQKPKILAIDDDVRMLRTLNEMLRHDYQISVAKDGAAARKFLENNTADVILLDYMMPDENGVEVLKGFRENEETAKIPVVFLTGLDDRRKILECLALKPAGYVVKPVEREKLLRKLKAVLGGSES